ncbi:MAG: AmmeMemoRadiSam system protein A [Methylococcaceae bacterium]
MSSTETTCRLSPGIQTMLLDIALLSIHHGLVCGKPFPVGSEGLAPELAKPSATFVTINLNGNLRGCVGSLQAVRPLASDVAYNAYAAAFLDRRFGPLSAGEAGQIRLHLSLLTPALPMQFGSEADLLSQIVPFEDGLILEDGGRRGTFLPSVWESLPRPEQFFHHLKLKAGLPTDHWSPTVRVWRYHTESIHQPDR